jgi:hypothetical protein
MPSIEESNSTVEDVLNTPSTSRGQVPSAFLALEDSQTMPALMALETYESELRFPVELVEFKLKDRQPASGAARTRLAWRRKIGTSGASEVRKSMMCFSLQRRGMM